MSRFWKECIGLRCICTITLFFEGTRILPGVFRLGLSIGFSQPEFLGRIALSERRLQGAAPTPLTLPYPFCKSTWTRIDAERDKLEVRFFFVFRQYTPELFLRLGIYICISWTNKSRNKISNLFHFPIGITISSWRCFLHGRVEALALSWLQLLCVVAFLLWGYSAIQPTKDVSWVWLSPIISFLHSGPCALETLWMDMMVFSALLSTTSCITWRGDSPEIPLQSRWEFMNEVENIFSGYFSIPHWVTESPDSSG